jgi:hypothetical protein
MPTGIAYSLKDYCELVDTTGRCIRDNKTGYIDRSQSPILERLGLDTQQWLTLTTEFEKHFCYAAGAELMMNAFKHHTHQFTFCVFAPKFVSHVRLICRKNTNEATTCGCHVSILLFITLSVIQS